VADATLVLLAAALLRVPGRRLRALALGDEGALRDWIAGESATRLAEARRDAYRARERLAELGARVVAIGAPEYPAGLRALQDPPPFLTVRGTLPAHAVAPEGTAIVGSRAADDRARAMARALAARAPGPIVSGLALGIDAAAHEGAVDAGIATYAYVGTGLGVTYPPEHRELEERIVAAGGAILSEHLPDEEVKGRWLVRRDRLQAGHAAAVVLVQSDLDGGAMHTIAAATKLGRPRYAFEPAVAAAYAGNERAIREGAVALPWDATLAARTLAEAG
jgi:DNA processing protein